MTCEKGVDKAYPIDALREERIVHDRIADVDLVVVASGTTSDAHIYENPDGLEVQLAGGCARGRIPAQDRGLNRDGVGISREKLTNSTDALDVLKAVPSNISFWFGWFAFHRGTELYGR